MMQEAERKQKTLTILATSDLHGRFYPWDYSLNREKKDGSMAQLLPAIREFRNETTLLVDAGDTIQENSADIFLRDPVHPMIAALNYLDYDVWTTGNHDYNYGLDETRRCIESFKGNALVGNVRDRKGEALAKGYVILVRGGIRAAVISMVTPNIDRWDRANLAGCKVTDPVEETRKILEEIDGQYDVLIGVSHMGMKNEYGRPNSGLADYTAAFPQFDLIVGAHEHNGISGQELNGVLVVENRSYARTMCRAVLTLEEKDGRWRVIDRSSEIIDISQYEPDPDFLKMFASFHEKALRDAEQVIGVMEDGPLVPPDEIPGIPAVQLEDTPLTELINDVQIYYSGADVSACSVYSMDANIQPGKIRKCDISHIYKHENFLCKLKMTGAMLKQYMEWSARYYNTFRPGDLTISFQQGIRSYSFDIFSGVNYEIDISREPGDRIRNLTWPDGRPVSDGEELTLAVSEYRASTQLCEYGEVYQEGELPRLLDTEASSHIGGVREMILDYIILAKDRVLKPKVDHNWKLTGWNWDETLHRRAAELVREGRLKIEESPNGRTPNIRSIREEDLKPAEAGNASC